MFNWMVLSLYKDTVYMHSLCFHCQGCHFEACLQYWSWHVCVHSFLLGNVYSYCQQVMSGLLILQCRLVLGYCAEWCIYIYILCTRSSGWMCMNTEQCRLLAQQCVALLIFFFLGVCTCFCIVLSTFLKWIACTIVLRKSLARYKAID